MYLKSLEMQGFKSFPDKTKLVFESAIEVEVQDGNAHGVTVIVGPNGSGKSNIADAMRWVLGEISSKSLRGTKMEDVIFGGADSRRPMGYAEVSVTFDNRGELGKLDCPYDEVMVTRRYFRSGDSEYFINRKGVRLKDIYELFMNTGIGRDGYSIIGQGRIAEMVSRKSEERRSVFEDASGIAKYRYKKNEAERKLAATQDNIDRVNDIYTEISAQVGPLEKAAEKAKKAMEAMENKKRADVSLWLYDTEKLREELDDAEKKLRHAVFDLKVANDNIQALESQNQELFNASQSNKQESEELLKAIQEKNDRLHGLENELSVAKNTIMHANELIKETQYMRDSDQQLIDKEKSEIDKYNQEIQEYQKNLAAEEQHDKALDLEKEELEKKIQELKLNIATALDDIQKFEQEEMDVKVRISVLENADDSDEDKNSTIAEEIEKYQKISKQLSQEAEDKEKTVKEYDEHLAGLDKTVEEKAKEVENIEVQIQESTQELNRHIFNRDSITQRLNTNRQMDEQMEGYGHAIRYVMKLYDEGKLEESAGVPCGIIYGPLSRVINVEEKYIAAIGMALGANIQNIVVENEATAKAAMIALKKAEAGLATFFPLTSMQPLTVTKEMTDASKYDGYIGVADALVNADKKFDNVLSALLGRTVVFDTIDHAISMAKGTQYRVRAVTLDGQMINAGGAFTGGSAKANKAILSRAGEIKRLEDELTAEKAKVDACQKQLDKLNAKFEDCKDEKDDAQSQKDLMTALRNSEANALEQVHAKYNANDTLLQKLLGDIKQFEEAKNKRAEDLVELHKEDKEIHGRIQAVKEYRQGKNEELGNAQLRVDDIGREKTDITIRVQGIEKDIENKNTLKDSAMERFDKFTNDLLMKEGRINTQKETVRVNTELIDNHDKIAEELKASIADLSEKRSKVEMDNLNFEKKLSSINAKMNDLRDQKELVLVEQSKCENKLGNLREYQDKLSSKLWDEYELTRNDAIALGYPPVTKENRSEMIALQTECRNRIKNIGPVDPDAVNKYNETKTRYDYYTGQLTDLEKAKKELTDIIDNLEKDMREVFVDSFNKINENFGKVFAELFGGGSAELSLSEPDNVLESGIEIKAAPPGKIIKSLMQLSGGEQAFIGVALFFAIIQVNPTPFCILDEIEAALDEVNVERLAQYIKRYSHGTQFIMITHRRGTMAAADRLYGVTMPEHGISKVLLLDVNDISKKEGEDWNGIFG